MLAGNYGITAPAAKRLVDTVAETRKRLVIEGLEAALQNADLRNPETGKRSLPPRVATATAIRGVALSYARIFLGLVILIAVLFYVLGVEIVAYIFAAFALFVLVIVIREGL